MIFCSNCGNKLVQASKFCTSCGTSTTSSNNDSTEQNIFRSPLLDTNKNSPQPQHKSFTLSTVETKTLSKKKKVLIGFLGFLILYTGYITLNSITNSPIRNPSTNINTDTNEVRSEEKNTVRFKNIAHLVEDDAVINEQISEGLLKELIVFTKSSGYKCDTVSSARPFVNDEGYNLKCNNYRYEYEIQDKGGNITITVK